jgi:hypothetical protein
MASANSSQYKLRICEIFASMNSQNKKEIIRSGLFPLLSSVKANHHLNYYTL